MPVIWACNNINGVDPAHLRRFSYALNMEAPDETVPSDAFLMGCVLHNLTIAILIVYHRNTPPVSALVAKTRYFAK